MTRSLPAQGGDSLFLNQHLTRKRNALVLLSVVGLLAGFATALFLLAFLRYEVFRSTVGVLLAVTILTVPWLAVVVLFVHYLGEQKFEISALGIRPPHVPAKYVLRGKTLVPIADLKAIHVRRLSDRWSATVLTHNGALFDILERDGVPSEAFDKLRELSGELSALADQRTQSKLVVGPEGGR